MVPKLGLMARIVKYASKLHLNTKNLYPKNSVPQNYKYVAAWSLKVRRHWVLAARSFLELDVTKVV